MVKYWKLHRTVNIHEVLSEILEYLNENMPVPSANYYGGVQQKPSCYDRISNSFIMGATIGITIGMLFGGLGGFRYFHYIHY